VRESSFLSRDLNMVLVRNGVVGVE
jgi:hypothetical protein